MIESQSPNSKAVVSIYNIKYKKKLKKLKIKSRIAIYTKVNIIIIYFLMFYQFSLPHATELFQDLLSRGEMHMSNAAVYERKGDLLYALRLCTDATCKLFDDVL